MRLIEMLNVENQRMESSLNDTEELIQHLAGETPVQGLLTAYTNLRRDYSQVFLENKQNDQVFRHQEDEKKWLRAQVREKIALIKKNKILEMEIQSKARFWGERLQKTEDQCEYLKEQSAGMQSKYEKTLSDNESLRHELTRLNQEHKLLLKQLGTVFGEP